MCRGTLYPLPFTFICASLREYKQMAIFHGQASKAVIKLCIQPASWYCPSLCSFFSVLSKGVWIVLVQCLCLMPERWCLLWGEWYAGDLLPSDYIATLWMYNSRNRPLDSDVVLSSLPKDLMTQSVPNMYIADKSISVHIKSKLRITSKTAWWWIRISQQQNLLQLSQWQQGHIEC